MLPIKTLLVCTLFALPLQQFDKITGDFEKRGSRWHYESTAYMRNGYYYICNEISHDSREPMCISWPVAHICIDNLSDMKSQVRREVPVFHPFHCHVATIFFGANLNDPQDHIECWMDENELKVPKDRYQEKLSSTNELGEKMELTFTASYNPQLHSTTFEIQTQGNADVLMENVQGLQQVANPGGPSYGWKVQPTKTPGQYFTRSKNVRQMIDFLDQGEGSKTFLYCSKLKNGESNPLVMTVPAGEGGVKDIAICLISKNNYQNVGLITKYFAD